jgi:hypothetical protein
VPEIITDSLDPVNCPAPFFTRVEQLRVLVEVIKPNEEPVVCPEEINDDLLQTSWAGWDRSLVRNRRHYTLKTKEIINFRAFSDIRTANEAIPEGTVVRFIGIDFGDGLCAAQAAEEDPGIPDIPLEDQFRPIESRDLFIFLSDEPFQSVDKVRDKLIDSGEMIGTELDFFIYSNGDLYTDIENIENTYPDIKQAIIPPVPSPTPTPTASPVVCTLFGTDFDAYGGVGGTPIYSDLEIANGEYAYIEFRQDGTFAYINEGGGLPIESIETWSTDATSTVGSNFEMKWEYASTPQIDDQNQFRTPVAENTWIDLGTNRDFRVDFVGAISCDIAIDFIITIRNTNIEGCEVSALATIRYYNENCT